MTDDNEKDNSAIRNLEWRDEILQVMYWMTGEGLGKEFAISDLQKFLQTEDAVLVGNLEEMISTGFLERTGENNYALTTLGEQEGGRRFADEFESMLKTGHFECDAPDCDCHNPDADIAACKHWSPAQAT